MGLLGEAAQGISQLAIKFFEIVVFSQSSLMPFFLRKRMIAETRTSNQQNGRDRRKRLVRILIK
jgi:hypothetical protein